MNGQPNQNHLPKRPDRLPLAKVAGNLCPHCGGNAAQKIATTSKAGQAFHCASCGHMWATTLAPKK